MYIVKCLILLGDTKSKLYILNIKTQLNSVITNPKLNVIYYCLARACKAIKDYKRITRHSL